MASKKDPVILPLMKRKTVVLTEDLDKAIAAQAASNDREFSAELRALVKEALAARAAK